MISLIGLQNPLINAFNKKNISTIYKSGFSMILSLLFAFPVHAQEEANTGDTSTFKPLNSYSVEYGLKSKHYKMSAKATRTFKINDENIASLEQSASILIAKISQQSKFKLDTQSCMLSNISYRYDRSIFGKRKSYKINFDYDNKQVVENNDGKKKTFPLEKAAYDELSYQELLRCQLMNSNNIAAGQEFDYLVRTKGKDRLYQFVVEGEEKINTKIGELDTLKLTRIRDPEDKNDKNFIWFAKDHNYLLVKLYQEDEDDTLELDILDIEKE